MKKAETTTAPTFSNGKDTQLLIESEPITVNFSENPIRQKIYELLLSGGKYSVVQLTVMFRVPDVRSHLRFIREAGVPISNYWVKSEYSKFKVYFIHEEGGNNEG